MSQSNILPAVFRPVDEMPSKLHEHDTRFDAQAAGFRSKFRALNKKTDGWQGTTATGTVVATHANVRNTVREVELEALKRRIGVLEGSLGTTGH